MTTEKIGNGAKELFAIMCIRCDGEDDDDEVSTTQRMVTYFYQKKAALAGGKQDSSMTCFSGQSVSVVGAAGCAAILLCQKITVVRNRS